MIPSIGCDFYAGSAHKRLLGPGGLGFLYVTQTRLDQFFPDFIMAPHDASSEALQDWADPLSAGRRMEIGTESVAIKKVW